MEKKTVKQASIQKKATMNRTMHDGEMFESLWNEEAIKREVKKAKAKDDIPRFKLDKIEMHVSKACNLKCSFCYGKAVVPEMERREWLPKEMIEKVLEDVRKNMPGQNPLIIYAGLYSEPLLHNEIEEILKETAVREYRFGFYTNGIKLTEPLMKTLIQCAKKTKTIRTKPSYISFNISALIDCIKEKPEYIKDLFTKLSCFSEENAKEKNPLVINASLLAIKGYTGREYVELVDDLIKTKIDNIRFSFPWVPQKNQSNTGLTRNEYQKASTTFSHLQDRYSKNKITIRYPAKDFERCFVGAQGISISSEGDVFFCPEVSSLNFKDTHSYGSIYEYDGKISHIWQGKNHIDLFRNFDPYTSAKECVCCHMDNVFNRYCSKFWFENP